MKGVVLAGGTGSRLHPLTKVTNKHLLPVGKVPMLFHPIAKLCEAGIDEICVVTGTDHMGDVVSLLGSGEEHGCDFAYRVQDRAGGIAEALGLAESFVKDEKMCVVLGDNIFEDSLERHVHAFWEQEAGARIILKSVDEPERFGVARTDGDRVTEIVEKPDDPPSSRAVTGVYFYDSRVFDIVDGLTPSERGEYEITDVNNDYIERGEMTFGEFDGWWTDAGTFPSYHGANRLVSESDLEAAEQLSG